MATPEIRIVALAICPKCKSEVTELTVTNPALCLPCWKQNRANKSRRERDQIRRDMGLKRVRGALGGVYWE